MGITPQLHQITEPPGLHLHDEEGTITSKFQTFFLRGFESQTRREEAAMQMAKRHRIARNAALDAYVVDMSKRPQTMEMGNGKRNVEDGEKGRRLP